jgi:hypothetical protein
MQQNLLHDLAKCFATNALTFQDSVDRVMANSRLAL